MDLLLQRALDRHDVEGLQRTLADVVSGEVRFDDGTRATYSTDASNYRRQPIGVVVPRTTADVIATVQATHAAGVPLLSRGGGTSLAGQCANTAVVMDFSKYLHDIVDIDPEARTATVQPGVVLDDLQDAARPHGLRFGPDPSTHDRCTLGGMIGNNSCGIHSVRTGRTADNVRSMDVITGDGVRLTVGPTSDAELDRLAARDDRIGEIHRGIQRIRRTYGDRITKRYADIPRRVSGFNLDELLGEDGCNTARALVGAESTCVTVLEATVDLVDDPTFRALVVLGYPDIYAAADHVPEILQHDPVGLEGIDATLIEYMKRKRMHPEDRQMLPAGQGWLLVEFGADTQEAADARARACMEDLAGDDAPAMALFDEPADYAHVWAIRESGLGATARVPSMPDTWPGWEDSAVHPTKVGDYLRDLKSLFADYGYSASVYGHFGDGCLHCRIPFDLQTAQGIDDYRRFLEDAADLVVSHGGSLSGEHGDGQARGALLEKQFGSDLVQAMEEFKALWDPDGRMNPGKVVDARPPTADLKLGTDHQPVIDTGDLHFAYPADGGDFTRATLRCVGVGKCRDTSSGTMCPSYMVTREEEHSTRGRARLLFEMADGNERLGGWESEEVADALDLCLSCKGCKSDCPVDVDMATYKAEFLSHHYEGRLRPRNAYAMGLIHWASRVAARMPDVANLVTHTPGLAHLLRWVGGVDQRREVPTFARETFREWFQRRPTPAPVDGPGQGQRVLIWPDTFNEHFHPEVGKATVEVLEALGYDVDIPPRMLCCGRPLYDYGMLDLARRQLHQVLDVLRDDIRAGVPLIGLEPSCLAVFRDELIEMLPHDQDAQRLATNAMMLTELLRRDADGIDFEAAGRNAGGRRIVLHGHCHQTSTWGLDADVDVLRRLGWEVEVLDSGCCGMAGSFGFEEGHHDVSVGAGERVWLPAVRQAMAVGEYPVTSGFSCREQVRQVDGERVFHTHEMLRAAFTSHGALAIDDQPRGVTAALRANRGAMGVGAVVLAGAAVAGRTVAGR